MADIRRSPEALRSLIEEKIPSGLVVAEHTNSEHWYRHTPSGELLPSVTTITGIMQSPHLKKWAAAKAADHIKQNFESMITMTSADRESVFQASIMAHEDIFHEAGDIGTQGHGIIEEYLKQWIETGSMPTDIRTFITGEDHRLWAITRSAEKFFKTYQAIPIASELKVAYVPKKGLGFAGTLDALMLLAFPTKPGRQTLPGMPEHLHEVSFVGSTQHKLECIGCGAKWQYYFTLVDFKTSNSILGKDEYLMQTAAYWKAIKGLLGIAPQRIVIVRLDKAQEKYDVLEVINPSLAFKSFRHLHNVYTYLKQPDWIKSDSIEKKELVKLDDI